jgi:hypothetical protein
MTEKFGFFGFVRQKTKGEKPSAEKNQFFLQWTDSAFKKHGLFRSIKRG